MEKLIITPKTKIYDLLAAYPELENVLIEAAPEFKKLKNPVLRKTIARITNISQAAVIGKLKVEDLVNKLRSEVGQDTISQIDDTGNRYNTICPGWFNSELVSHTIDIREMLDSGEQPVHEIMAAIKKQNKNEILQVIAPFVPAPLIDKTLSMGYNHWIDKINDKEYKVFFQKSES